MTFTYRVLLRPSDICFQQKLLPSSFDGGIPLRETLQQLQNEEILIEDIPTIDVVWCQKKWVWYTLNNRRLWVFRELEKLGKCHYIATRRIDTIEHMTDFLLYGSAELIGESNIVEWHDEGCRITVFNDDKSAQNAASPEPKVFQASKESKEKVMMPRNWREMTPLTVTVKWNEVNKLAAKSEDDERLVTPEHASRAESVESKRERKDSGYCETSSGRTSPRELSSCNESDFSEVELADQDEKSSSRFSKFRHERPRSAVTFFTRRKHSSLSSRSSRDNSSLLSRESRSYSRPVMSVSPCARRRTKAKRKGIKRRKSIAAPPCRASAFSRKENYEKLMFVLHHGGKPRLEQLALKTKLMNTCGFCFKSFRAGVSLSQHIEELRHWACSRCGKYFESYTSLGQHKMDLDHCNVY